MRLLIATLAVSIAVIAAGILIDDADARRACQQMHLPSTCNHILRG